MLSLAVAAVIGVVLTSAMASGMLTFGAAGKQSQGLVVEGVATISVIAPDGHVVGVWTQHNTLTAQAINLIVECLGVGPGGGIAVVGYMTPWTSTLCPTVLTSQGTTATAGVTEFVDIAMGGCTVAVYSPSANCELVSPATNSPTPSGCEAGSVCTGWVASATFSPTALSGACSGYFAKYPNTCLLNMVATDDGRATFDQITPSSQIVVSSGDSLAINIQFTVS